jgi:hypothetical protein
MAINKWNQTMKVGVRGVAYDPDGRIVLEYMWTLVTATNNELEALVVLRGLTALTNKRVWKTTVIGGSMVITRALWFEKPMKM